MALSALKRLQRLYQTSDEARRILDWIAETGYSGRGVARPSGLHYDDQTLTEVEEIQYVQSLDLSRASVIEFMKFLDVKAKVGQYTVGRRQGRTRFSWWYEPMSVVEAARGGEDALVEIQDQGEAEVDADAGEPAAPSASPANGTVYRRKVRGGEVLVSLPEDLTGAEAEQVATYLEGLAQVVRLSGAGA